jgi:AcrR family transcriptional regulator
MTKSYNNYIEKKAVIVSAAKHLFFQRGYSATSMDQVAKTAGVTKQTVYRYFPSKLNLFKATMESAAGGVKGSYAFGDNDLKSELTEFSSACLQFHFMPDRLAIARLIISEGCSAPELTNVFFETGPKNSWSKVAADFFTSRFKKKEVAQEAGRLICEMVLAVRMPVLLGIREIPTEKEMISHVHLVVDFFLAGCRSYAWI